MQQLLTRKLRMSAQLPRGDPGAAADATALSRMPSMARMVICP